MENKPHFTALLTYLNEEESGKSTPYLNGTRAGFLFSYQNKIVFGNKNFTEQDLVYPNDIVKTEITLFTNLVTLNKIYVGLDFDFFEGDVLIGKGIITKLLDSDFVSE